MKQIKTKWSDEAQQLLKDGYAIIKNMGKQGDETWYNPFFWIKENKDGTFTSMPPENVPDYIKNDFPDLFGIDVMSPHEIPPRHYIGKLLIAALHKLADGDKDKEMDIFYELKQKANETDKD